MPVEVDTVTASVPPHSRGVPSSEEEKYSLLARLLQHLSKWDDYVLGRAAEPHRMTADSIGTLLDSATDANVALGNKTIEGLDYVLGQPGRTLDSMMSGGGGDSSSFGGPDLGSDAEYIYGRPDPNRPRQTLPGDITVARLDGGVMKDNAPNEQKVSGPVAPSYSDVRDQFLADNPDLNTVGEDGLTNLQRIREQARRLPRSRGGSPQRDRSQDTIEGGSVLRRIMEENGYAPASGIDPETGETTHLIPRDGSRGASRDTVPEPSVAEPSSRSFDEGGTFSAPSGSGPGGAWYDYSDVLSPENQAREAISVIVQNAKAGKPEAAQQLRLLPQLQQMVEPRSRAMDLVRYGLHHARPDLAGQLAQSALTGQEMSPDMFQQPEVPTMEDLFINQIESSKNLAKRLAEAGYSPEEIKELLSRYESWTQNMQLAGGV